MTDSQNSLALKFMLTITAVLINRLGSPRAGVSLRRALRCRPRLRPDEREVREMRDFLLHIRGSWLCNIGCSVVSYYMVAHRRTLLHIARHTTDTSAATTSMVEMQACCRRRSFPMNSPGSTRKRLSGRDSATTCARTTTPWH